MGLPYTLLYNSPNFFICCELISRSIKTSVAVANSTSGRY